MSDYSPTPFPDKYRSLGELPSKLSGAGDGSSFQRYRAQLRVDNTGITGVTDHCCYTVLTDHAQCRWEGVHSKEAFMVKKMPLDSSAMDNEVASLSVLKQCQVSNVIQLMEVLTAANSYCYFVFE